LSAPACPAGTVIVPPVCRLFEPSTKLAAVRSPNPKEFGEVLSGQIMQLASLKPTLRANAAVCRGRLPPLVEVAFNVSAVNLPFGPPAALVRYVFSAEMPVESLVHFALWFGPAPSSVPMVSPLENASAKQFVRIDPGTPPPWK